MSYDSKCQCEWEKVKETHSKGENIFGKMVECYGWDLKCKKCGTTSWMRNNEEEEV